MGSGVQVWVEYERPKSGPGSSEDHSKFDAVRVLSMCLKPSVGQRLSVKKSHRVTVTVTVTVRFM